MVTWIWKVRQGNSKSYCVFCEVAGTRPVSNDSPMELSAIVVISGADSQLLYYK